MSIVRESRYCASKVADPAPVQGVGAIQRNRVQCGTVHQEVAMADKVRTHVGLECKSTVRSALLFTRMRSF